MNLYLIIVLALTWAPDGVAANKGSCSSYSHYGRECYTTGCPGYCPSGFSELGKHVCGRLPYRERRACVRSCAAGTVSHSPSPGQYICKKCDPGYSSFAKSTFCFACPAGEFSPTSGSVRCNKCPAGKYSTRIGSTSVCRTACTSCTNCPANTYSGQGATYCIPCRKGFISSPGSSSCRDANECTNGQHACPKDSVCQNTAGSYACRCNEGFYVTGTENEQISYTHVMSCSKKLLDTVVSDLEPTSFKISTKTLVPLSKIRIEASRVSPFDEDVREEIGRSSIALREVTATELQNGVEYVNLKPGTKLELKYFGFSGGIEDTSYRTSQILQSPCNCPGNNDEAPSDFTVEQKFGFVEFSFVDKSLCADTFMFKRFKVDENDSQISAKGPLASEYNVFKSGDEICQSKQIITPGREARDDIDLSNLKVGEKYQYELTIKSSVTGITYSTPIPSPTHTIQWEASIAGVVTTNPEIGAYPVESVYVECVLRGPEITISTFTDEAGKYECLFRDKNNSNYGYEFTNDDEYAVDITFRKSTLTNTSVINHEFLCREGAQDCTIEPLRVNIKHLEFNKPVTAYDISAFPINGKVSIAETGGCPLSGVEICLYQYIGNSIINTSVCTETNSLGEYSILASIQTRVGLRASYNEHELVPAGNTKWVDNGIQILEGEEYNGFDFEDVQKANMTVEVGGGLCNINLGKSKLKLKVQGCISYSEELDHVGFRNVFNVPAHKMSLEIIDIRRFDDNEKRQAIIDYFVDEERNFDLTDQNEEESVLFQYEGVAQISPKFYKVEANQYLRKAQPEIDACVNPGDLPYDAQQEVEDDQFKSYSFHVLDDKTHYLLSADVKMYIDDDLPLCDRFPVGATVSIRNQLGYSEGTKESDIEALENELQDKGVVQSVLDVLGKCVNGACSLPVVPANQSKLAGAQRSNAQVEFDFLTGYPNFFEPYTRKLAMRTTGLFYPVQHICEVVVEGSRLLENFGSFALPQSEPIMVLRDPPGSKSYSYYKNVETKIELVSEHDERSRKWNVDVFAGFAGKSGEEVGLGFGLKVSEVEAIAGYKGLFEKSVIENYNDEIHSGKLSTTWSYETSQDVWTAGRNSDTFVIPSLNIIFNERRFVSWNEGDCRVIDKTQTEFDLDDTSKIISFVSHYFIKTEEIPRLVRLLNEKKANYTSQQLGEFEENKLGQEINLLQESLDKWEEIIQDHADISLAAKNGNMNKLLRANAYVEEKVINELPTKVKNNFKGYTRPFIPKTLTSKVDDPEEYDSFKFDGGGSLLKYEWSHEAMSRISRRSGSDEDNEGSSRSNGFSFSSSAAIGGVASLGGPIKLISEFTRDIYRKEQRNEDAETNKYIQTWLGRRLETETNVGIDKLELNRRRELFQLGLDYLSIKVEHKLQLSEDSTSTESTAGFVLGDEDSGDYFDVNVFIDKKYGTFVFHTTSGESKCPVEPGTTAREVPFISINEEPSAPVLPNEKMIFKIFLQNKGTDLTSLQLNQDPRTNTDGLSVFANTGNLGQPLPIPRILAREGYETLLTISRGPVLYEYPPVTISFRSLCEATRNIGDGNLIAMSDGEASQMQINLSNAQDSEGNPIIRFERPCPEIVWSDSLEAIRNSGNEFILNVDTYKDVFEIAIRNPNRNLYKLADVNRLEEIKVWYRRQGVGDWTRAQDPTGSLIDMKALDEDEFGYIQATWDIKSLFDGNYQVYVECDCEKFFGSPKSFEKARTESLKIVQDTESPQLYGLPTPFEVVTLNSPVNFVFSEPIQCLKPFSFKVRAIIEDSDTFYDEDNLVVLCEGRSVQVSFEKTFRWENVIGRSLVVTIQDVLDLNNNILQETLSHQVRFPSPTTDSVLIQFNLRMQTDCLNITNKANHTQILATEVANLLQLDASRVAVIGVQCERAGLLVAKITVSPPTDTNERRILSDDIDPSFVLDTLVEMDKLVGESSLLNHATLDRESFVITTKDTISGAQGTSSIAYTPESPAMKTLETLQTKLESTSTNTHQSLEELRQKSEANEASNARLETILIGLSVTVAAALIGGLVLIARTKHNLREKCTLDTSKSKNPVYELPTE